MRSAQLLRHLRISPYTTATALIFRMCEGNIIPVRHDDCFAEDLSNATLDSTKNDAVSNLPRTNDRFHEHLKPWHSLERQPYSITRRRLDAQEQVTL